MTFKTQAELDAYRQSSGIAQASQKIDSIGIASILNPFLGKSRIEQDLGPPPPEVVNQNPTWTDTFKTAKNLKFLTYLAVLAILSGLLIWYLFYRK